MDIKLAIFDMDGTVFKSHLNWPAIRKELNLENKNSLKEIFHSRGVDMDRLKILENHEKVNTMKTRPIPGISRFLAFLKSNEVVITLTTNNSKKNTEYLLKKFNLGFDWVIPRESMLWKPDPDAFNFLMKKYQVTPGQTMAIGDSEYDILASNRAQIPYIFIKTGSHFKINLQPGVVLFSDFFELEEIIKSRFYD